MVKIVIEDFVRNSGIDENKVSEYYANHTLKECAEFFNVSERVMKEIILFFNIKLKTKSEIDSLINSRKLKIKLDELTRRIPKDYLESIFYKYPIKDCLQILNLKSYSDLLHLLDYYNIKRKTYDDRAKTIKQTLLRLYGVENISQVPEIAEKIQEKFRNMSDDDKAAINLKIKKTKYERYGDANYCNPDKAKDTIIDRFGSRENFNTYCKKKSIETNNRKYNKDWYMQTDEYRKKYIKTCNEKYNCDYFCQSQQYIANGRKSYCYNSIYFDSSWELALWLYAIAHDESIVRLPTRFTYYADNKKHYYYPDFLYKGMLIEIKGNHMLDENNNLKDGYNSGLSDEYLTNKQLCIESNNVIIWSKKDVSFALDWCKENRINLKEFKV